MQVYKPLQLVLKMNCEPPFKQWKQFVFRCRKTDLPFGHTRAKWASHSRSKHHMCNHHSPVHTDHCQHTSSVTGTDFENIYCNFEMALSLLFCMVLQDALQSLLRVFIVLQIQQRNQEHRFQLCRRVILHLHHANSRLSMLPHMGYRELRAQWLPYLRPDLPNGLGFTPGVRTGGRTL